MNSTIETLLSHKSIRKFREDELTAEQIQTLVKAAQAGSTSSDMQPYTIIGVNDQGFKEQLAELSGNKYVAKNGHFFVFCMDLNRHKLAIEVEGLSPQDYEGVMESTEWFMFGLIDTAIAAQNLATAAESMGLGICYIGGIRNNLPEVSKLLKTPDRVIPLFGMCVGYPDQDPNLRPRLPMENVYHENVYQQDEESFKKQLEEHNQITSEYYRERTKGKRADRRTEQVLAKLKQENRMYIKEFLKEKRLPFK